LWVKVEIVIHDEGADKKEQLCSRSFSSSYSSSSTRDQRDREKRNKPLLS